MENAPTTDERSGWGGWQTSPGPWSLARTWMSLGPGICCPQVPCPWSTQARRLKISMLTPPRAAHASPVTPLAPPALPFTLQTAPWASLGPALGPHYCAGSCLLGFALVWPCPDIQLGASVNATCLWSGAKLACLKKPSKPVTPCLGPLLGSVWGLKYLHTECLVPSRLPQGLVPGEMVQPPDVHAHGRGPTVCWHQPPGLAKSVKPCPSPHYSLFTESEIEALS